MAAPAPCPHPALRPLAGVDPAAVERLLDRAFGPARRQRTAYRLRDGLAPDPATSFAIVEGGALVALLQSWPILLHDMAGGSTPLLLVGPVAVLPERQREGLGRRLMAALLGVAGDRPLVLIGDPEIYARYGFVADATGGWTLPGPVERHRLLARLPADAALPAAGRLVPR